MAVAIAGIGIALDRSIRRNRHRTGIALASKRREVDVHRRLRTAHHNIRDADVRAAELAGAEIRMQANRRTDEGKNGRRIRIYRRGRDVLIPRIAGREGHKAVQASALAEGNAAAGAGAAATTSTTAPPAS